MHLLYWYRLCRLCFNLSESTSFLLFPLSTDRVSSTTDLHVYVHFTLSLSRFLSIRLSVKVTEDLLLD